MHSNGTSDSPLKLYVEQNQRTVTLPAHVAYLGIISTTHAKRETLGKKNTNREQRRQNDDGTRSK